MRIRSLIFLLAFAPALLLAQGQIKLDFGDAGEREVWISDQLAMPPSTLKATEATLDLPIQGGKTDKLYVWDRKSGNLASRPITEIKGTWKLAPQDFKLVGKVTVRVEHEGKRVAIAFIKLKDGSGDRESQIDPGKNGEASFFGVQPGNVAVTVRYNSKGVDADPAQQTFILNPKRAEPDPTFIVSLTQEVETVAGGSSDAKKEPTSGSEAPKKESGEEPTADAKAPAKSGSIIGSMVVYLLALGAAGAAIWFGLKYMKDNQDKVKDQLQKIGVQVPDPQDPAQQDPGPAPVPVAPVPPQKIILDDADPNVPVAPSNIPSPASPLGQPSLVMENGDVFPLPEGETLVGREAGNGLSLVTENTVSRKHAAVVKDGVNVLVRDLGSSNGTFVNGVKVTADTVLKPGDQVQFGQARFRYEA